MSQAPRNVPIAFAKEEQFNVTIQRVRDLSEGKLRRDPEAKVVKLPPPFKPVIYREVQPRIRGSIKFQKWCIRKAEAMGKTMDEFKKWRSGIANARYHANKKKWRTV
jgi:hypothetical protein